MTDNYNFIYNNSKYIFIFVIPKVLVIILNN